LSEKPEGRISELMIRKRDRRPLYVACVAVPLIAAMYLFDLPVPRSIGTIVYVRPGQTWMLMRGTEGQLIGQLTDHRTGTTTDLQVVQFERGEAMSLHMSPSAASGSTLHAGDTVARVSSSSIFERLAQIRREVAITRATLAARSAGDRTPLVEEARRKVEYAETDVREKDILHSRLRELHTKGYASQEEFDVSLARLRKAQLDREMASAQLAACTTGSKPEDLAVLRTTVEAYAGEIGLLTQRLDGCVIRSPLSGPVVRRDGSDTLIVVTDTSCTMLDIPFRYSQAQGLCPGEHVAIRVSFADGQLEGTITSVAPEAETVNGIQIVHARIQVHRREIHLTPGLLLPGTVVLPPVPFKEYVRSALFD
jgi:hypothetical protein